MLLSEASKVMQGQLSGVDQRFTSVEFDTRRLDADALFFAIHGDSQNGHKFIQQAMLDKAAAAVADETFPDDQGIRHIKVDDTTVALGRLASDWRQRFTLPVVGITGSNGKTSVTNILKEIFARSIPGVAPQGSFNNQWGVPLTLLKLRDEHQSAVIEMGMNHVGELAYLGKIVKPTIGLITNAAAAHLEGLGDVQGVADAKGELIDSLDHEGVVILNRDDQFYGEWKARAGTRRVISFGTHLEADVQLIDSDTDKLQVRIYAELQQFQFSLIGQHNQLNAAAAIAAAISADVKVSAIADGLKNVSAVKGRLEVVQKSSNSFLIDDTYNANAASMFAAIDVLTETSGQKILVLGGMGELGKDSAKIHHRVATYAKQQGVDCLLTLVDHNEPGYLNDMAAYSSGFGGQCFAFTEVPRLVDKLNSLAQPSRAVLVKGSRFAQMERVVDAIMDLGSAQC